MEKSLWFCLLLFFGLGAVCCSRHASPNLTLTKRNNKKKSLSNKKHGCPLGFTLLPKRTLLIKGMLERHPLSALVWKKVRKMSLSFCWGEIKSPVVTDAGSFLLHKGWSDGEVAARVGHLALHLLRPIRFVRGVSCEVQVRRALQKEAEAWALELRLHRAFGVKKTKRDFFFTSDFWKKKPEKQTSFLLDSFFSPPPRDTSVPPLYRDYTIRCLRLQKALQ